MGLDPFASAETLFSKSSPSTFIFFSPQSDFQKTPNPYSQLGAGPLKERPSSPLSKQQSPCSVFCFTARLCLLSTGYECIKSCECELGCVANILAVNRLEGIGPPLDV